MSPRQQSSHPLAFSNSYGCLLASRVQRRRFSTSWTVLRDMLFLFVYLDDILVASASADDHLTHLRQLFRWLSEHGLIINPAKCEFGRSSITFLGHHVTPEGAVPLPAKVDAVASFPHPRTVKSLQEFLGMANFYNRFPMRPNSCNPCTKPCGAGGRRTCWIGPQR